MERLSDIKLPITREAILDRFLILEDKGYLIMDQLKYNIQRIIITYPGNPKDNNKQVVSLFKSREVENIISDTEKFYDVEFNKLMLCKIQSTGFDVSRMMVTEISPFMSKFTDQILGIVIEPITNISDFRSSGSDTLIGEQLNEELERGMLHLEGWSDFFKNIKKEWQAIHRTKKYLTPTRESILDRFVELEDEGYLIKSTTIGTDSSNFGFIGLTFLYKNNSDYGSEVIINNNKILDLMRSRKLHNIVYSIGDLYNLICDNPRLFRTTNGYSWIEEDMANYPINKPINGVLTIKVNIGMRSKWSGPANLTLTRV